MSVPHRFSPFDMVASDSNGLRHPWVRDGRALDRGRAMRWPGI